MLEISVAGTGRLFWGGGLGGGEGRGAWFWIWGCNWVLILDIGFWIVDPLVFFFFLLLRGHGAGICISAGRGLIVFGHRHGLLGCWLTK